MYQKNLEHNRNMQAEHEVAGVVQSNVHTTRSQCHL